jgi:predicted CXXCH cytochrome family protein
MTVMEFNLVSISLSLPQGSADLIEIRVNNKKKVSIVPRQKFECSFVSLELGINEINITAKKEAIIVDEAALRVFRRSDLVSKYTKSPAGFQKDYFHVRDHPRCAACHHILEHREADKKPINIEMFAAEISKNKTVVPPESTCYSCHRGMTSYPFVHGPNFVWSCLTCHNSHAEPRYSVKFPFSELCYKCHVEQKQKRSGKKNYHAPYINNKCGICHNPHASENPYRLVKPTWLLCVSCHPDQGDGRHIIAGFFWRGSRRNRHPTHGVLDPLREGQELTCASCHNPHASNSSKFIRLNADRGFELCGKCHINNERKLLFPYQAP